MDLNPFGIRVGAIHPEWCRLNLVKCALKEIRIEPKKYIKGSCPYNQKISPTSFFVVSRPYHINIADLVVMSTAQASSTIIKN
jgi:NADP-dependent 3-hydroxy acid dehydrogenase YdfG